MNTDESAFTFVETIIVLFFSMTIFLTLTIIPHRMIDSYSNYLGEAKKNITLNSIVNSVHNDLIEGESITLNESGFTIGESHYVYTDNKLIRKADGSNIELNEVPVTYQVIGEIIYIQDKPLATEEGHQEPSINIEIPHTINLSQQGGR